MRELAQQGVVFRHQGQDPATGLDCINYPRWGVRKQGIELPPDLEREFDAYSENPDGWRMMEIMRRWFQEFPVADNTLPPEAMPGDLLQLYVKRNPKHLAVIVNREPLIVVEAWMSADKKQGKVIEWPLDFRRRIAACFRIPDFVRRLT